jgi:5-(carboxyamino)imidazole ribonucleotide synthase
MIPDMASPALPAMLAPGTTIGILGGGQLGRMLAQAAAALGFRAHIFAPEFDSPAFEVTSLRSVAAYADEMALARFAEAVDVVTYEFENVPVDAVRFLEARVPVRPGSKALAVAQDRLAEKRLACDLGARTAEFAAVVTRDDLTLAMAATGVPAVLKTVRFGYDGKGQAKIRSHEEADAAHAAMRGQPAILESFVAFTAEISVVAARGLDGAFAPFAVTLNDHRNHVLHRSLAPAGIGDEVAARATGIARAIADALDYVGVLGVEFFVVGAGESQTVLLNEIAPRVHNSGHWTMDGAVTSQFEQHIRAVAGWPLGSARMVAPAAEMINLIGPEADGWAAIVRDGEAKLHLYGKTESRPGRKMGHVNRLLQHLPR